MYDIIAVDDSAIIRKLLGKVFDKLGWKARLCAGAEEALAFLEREETRVLVTDINMPGMTGAAFAHQVRARHPELTIIALTASVTADELDPKDFTDVLRKPFQISELSAALAKYLAAAQVTNGQG